MGDTLQQTTDSLQQTVGDPVQTVDTTVQQTAADPVQTVENTVQQTAGDPVQAVDNTVQQTAGDPVEAVDNTVQQTAGDPVQAVGDATQPVTSNATDAVGGVGQTGTSLVDGAAANAGSTLEKATGDGGGALAGAHEALRGSTEQLSGASAPLTHKVTTTIENVAVPGSGTDTTLTVPPNLPEHVTPFSGGVAGAGDAVSGSGGILDAPFGGTDLLAGADEIVIFSAAVVTAASIAMAVRPSTIAGTQFFLANARQIPAMCGGMAQGVSRDISAAAAGAARLGSLAASVPDRMTEKAADAVQAVREGFREGVEGAPGNVFPDDGDRADDIRLLMQIGMLLGAVYVAFLSVWFWATRLRWSPRV